MKLKIGTIYHQLMLKDDEEIRGTDANEDAGIVALEEKLSKNAISEKMLVDDGEDKVSGWSEEWGH